MVNIKTIVIRYDADIDQESTRCLENDIAEACETHVDILTAEETK